MHCYHIYCALHVYLDNNNIKTGIIWPEEIESFHARQRTMVALEESLSELGIARGIYGGSRSVYYSHNIIE